MFPPQTSLIPVTVAVARFTEEFISSEGWLATLKLAGAWYPYWYLGVPFRYLTGPIVPLFLFIARKILPNASLFTSSIYLLGISFAMGAFGWGAFSAKVTKSKKVGFVVAILLSFLPWRYFSSIALSETSEVIAKNFLPYALIAFFVYLKNKNKGRAFLSILAISTLFLINTSIIPILLVGMVSLILAVSFSKGKFTRLTKHIKLSLITLSFALILVTLWYTPGYWLTVILNPSIGGAAGYKVFLRIVDLLKVSLPLVFAIAAVYFSGKIKSRLLVFSLTWTLTFIFLTVFRFIGDPDFWQDWTSWVFELETGIALIAALPLAELFRKLNGKKTDVIYSIKIYIVIFAGLVTSFLVTKYIYSVLGKPRLISKEPPEGVKSLSVLADIAEDKRVFLSGSTVFWANALYDLVQVRGGVDKAAIHPLWDHAAYQLREGKDADLALVWLQTLGVEYVLVHGPASAESYHDFRYLDKWKSVGQEVWQGEGDIIYKISNSSLAWEVDSEKVRSAKKPQNGQDLEALEFYLSARMFPVHLSSTAWGYKITSEQPMNSVLLIANFDKRWNALTNGGRKIQIQKDSLGNMLIFPQLEKEILLKE